MVVKLFTPPTLDGKQHVHGLFSHSSGAIPPRVFPLTIVHSRVVLQVQGLQSVHPGQLRGQGLDLDLQVLQVAAWGAATDTGMGMRLASLE